MSRTAPQFENRRHSHTGLQTRIDEDGNIKEREFVVRGPSRYDIYNSTEKPFGESYRRSVQRSLSTDDISPPKSSFKTERNLESPVDNEAVKENMGTYVSTLEERRKSNDKNFTDKDGIIISEGKPQNKEKNSKTGKHKDENKITINITNDLDKCCKPGSKVQEDDKNIVTIIDNSTVQNGSKSSEEKKVNKDLEQLESNAREALMKEIREGKKLNSTENNDESTNHEDAKKKTTNYCSSEKPDCSSNSFVEEEYSYEPEKEEATSKVVLRSRSMGSLGTESNDNFKNTLNAALSGVNRLKITTGPDGTFRYGSRRASSESNLIDEEDTEEIKAPENPARNSYVSNLKHAFDANEERAKKDSNKTEVFDGLRHYLHENRYGLRELLVNNNVVIIEPFRNNGKKKPEDPSDYNHRQLEGFDLSCRITGATVKSQNDSTKEKTASNTLPRTAKSQHNSVHNRHVFYHPIKVNRELVDAELPDPDKVKSAREMFEKAFKPNTVTVQLPPSGTKKYHTSPRVRVTPEVRVIQEGQQKLERRRHGRFIVDPVIKDEPKQRLQVNKRWSDNGSLSSGVSSDLSFDNDLQNELSSNGSHRDTMDTLSSEEDDYQYGYDHERHPVSPEVLQKIRACGTSVTYYGGKIISHSDGPIRSPMTMTIMDEIRQSIQSEGRRNHSFSESQEPYLGVKFRLVKSNSCGSRLELAGTDENDLKLRRSHHESFIGKTISEETINEVENSNKDNFSKEENKTIYEEDEEAVEADRYVKPEVIETEVTVHTWADIKLKEARKQWHCTPEAVRLPEPDMEFETFEVLEDSSQLRCDNNPTGRG